MEGGEQPPKIRIVVSDLEDKVQTEVVEVAEKYALGRKGIYGRGGGHFLAVVDLFFVFFYVSRIFKEEADRGANVKEVASRLKSHLDSSQGKTWHVVVGSSFGSAVDALSKGFLHFYYGDLAFLVFRTL